MSSHLDNHLETSSEPYFGSHSETYFEIIKKQLHQREFDVIGIIPIPNHSDRMVRIRTLQEMIDDFEGSSHEGTLEYLLQIKPKKQTHPSPPKSDPTPSKLIPENIYLPNGKLNIPFLLKNGDLLLEAREYLLARNIFKSILRSGEYTGPTLFRLGKCLEAEGRLTEAQASYEESSAFQPTLDCYRRLGALLLGQKKDHESAEIFERALNLKDLSKETRFELHKTAGNCWTRANKGSDAERHFKNALDLDPSADDIRSNLGSLALQNGKIPEARRYFRDAVASNPKNHLALAGLGSCALSENDKTDAHQYFTQSLELEINNPTAIFHLVRCAYEIKSYATAARLLEAYILIAPVNANLLYSLAGLQFHLGRMNDARSAVLRLLELQSNHIGAKDLLTMIERYAGGLS